MFAEFEEICNRLKINFDDRRGICSKANDELIENLSSFLNLNCILYKTGNFLEGWKVPMGWELIKANISIGNRNFNSENCKLIVPFGSKSFSFSGKYSKIKDLLNISYSNNDAVPYRTQYYQSDTKPVICLPLNVNNKIEDDEKISIEIQTNEYDHHLNIGELLIEGESKKTIIITTYNCHPGLGNDNFSGLLSWAYLAKKIKENKKNFYTYRFVVAPETIGSIAYIKYLESIGVKENIIHTFILTCLGGKEKNYTYKKSPYPNGYSRYVENFLLNYSEKIDLRNFSHDGSDERQYSSPGVRISSSSLCRNRYYEYPQYHNSLDTWEYMNKKAVWESTLLMHEIIKNADKNVRLPTALSRFGEPSLSSLGISFHLGGSSLNNSGEFQGMNKKEFFDLFSLCNGNNSFADIVEIFKEANYSKERLIELFTKLIKLKVVEF